MPREIATGGAGFYLASINNALERGHKRKASDFKLEVEGYPIFSDMVVSIELPQLKREALEEVIPYIGKVRSQGRPEIGGSVACSFQEVVGGPVHKAVQEIVKLNKQLTIHIYQLGEMDPTSEDVLTLKYAQIGLDGTELSYDNGQRIEFNGSISYAYCSQYFEK